MQLNKQNLTQIPPQPELELPVAGVFDLPERVLQFGTGVLLRGLPDYFINKANNNGIFNGRIVVVKSTTQGAADAFAEQDSLFTTCIRGIENDHKVETFVVNAAISRVLSASQQWQDVLACAASPHMQVVVSNTTEVGIVLVQEQVVGRVPESFPGKLLAFLYERFRALGGSADTGMVIVPTELLADNGSRLRSIVIELAVFNQLGNDFIQWLTEANHFCNTLVDRIVPGKLPAAEQTQLEQRLGYTDELMITAEPFALWAIESGSARVQEVLSFATADNRVVIAPDIEKFRELKLRLLNGAHTFTCALAHLNGFISVKEAMHDEAMAGFVRRLVILEIAESIDSTLASYNEACAFANSVLDRFRNPFLEHRWLSIALNYTAKMRMRNIPLLLRYYQQHNKVPVCMALGFAAYIRLMCVQEQPDGNFTGKWNGRSYTIQDEHADFFAEKWALISGRDLVHAVLSHAELWGTDLATLPGFEAQVTEDLLQLQEGDPAALLTIEYLNKSLV